MPPMPQCSIIPPDEPSATAASALGLGTGALLSLSCLSRCLYVPFVDYLRFVMHFNVYYILFIYITALLNLYLQS